MMLSRKTRGRLMPRTLISRHNIFQQNCSSPVSHILSSARHHVILRQSIVWPHRRFDYSSSLHDRGMATAVDDYRLDPSSHNAMESPHILPFNITPLESNYIKLPDPGPGEPTGKMNIHGVPGDLRDLLPLFHACIRVHKLERAERILRRINRYSNLSGEELVVLHNRYLRAWIDSLSSTTDRSSAEALHKWFELEIRAKEVACTAETIACMLKASLLSERGPRLDRLVARYMEMAPGESALAVLGFAEILNASDIAVITKLYPSYEYVKTIERSTDMDDAPPSTTKTEAEAEAEAKASSQAAMEDEMFLRETAQRGMSMQLLKQELSVLQKLEAVDISTLPESQRRDIQLALERDAVNAAITKWRTVNKELYKMGRVSMMGSPSKGTLASTISSWFSAMEDELREEVSRVEQSEMKATKTALDLERCMYGPLLRQSEPSRLAAITILCVVNFGALRGVDKGLLVSSLVHTIARYVQDDIDEHNIQEAIRAERKRHLLEYRGRLAAEQEAGEDASDGVCETRWPEGVKEKEDDGAEGVEEKEDDGAEGVEENEDDEAEEFTEEDDEAEELTEVDIDAALEEALEGTVAKSYGGKKKRGRPRKPGKKATPGEKEPPGRKPKPNKISSESAQAEEKIEAATRQRWSKHIQAYIGCILVKMLAKVGKVTARTEHPKTGELVTQVQPAFTHFLQARKGRKVGVLFFNPAISRMLRSEPIGDFMAKQLPMVVEPRPWVGYEQGGFLNSKTALMRIKHGGDEEQRLYAQASIESGHMEQVFRGLDVLGRTAWRINEPLLMVMMQAWNTGEAIANIPPANPKIEIPEEPPRDSTSREHYQWLRAVKAAENKKSAYHSQRCFMNLQLEIARTFRKQRVYFPHNVDYRGRAYPIPSYLNHMGADHSRAILNFADKKKLGKRGFRWLKIHLANVYGLDKSSLSEREAFTNEHIDDIVDSATNALGGRRWWLAAECPWQCLAACMEVKAALELADPTEYLCNLPIHQDGTCNGLQHYAALGGDVWGAKQVNLEPSDRPADVYSAVAELVKESIKKDVACDNPFAKALHGKVTRKVVKQTVMTNVYGVTFSGAKSQVCKQIDDLYPNLYDECGIPHLMLATYVARLIFGALATMFKGAHDIQYWLGEVGNRVCRALTPSQVKELRDAHSLPDDTQAGKPKRGRKRISKGPRTADELAEQFRSTVVWTTPLRMTVVQPYRKYSQREVRTSLQTIIFSVNDQTDAVDRRKQLQAFPPNFIHSLDASHMILSALRCNELGLTFAAVHDSFWTHACDVDIMNNVLREAFISIHEEDVIGRLADEFMTRHDGSIYLAKFESSSVVAKKIREFRRANRMSAVEEVLLESKRQQLLRSSKESDREEGRSMVTPGSIYEIMSSDEANAEAMEETKPFALGEVSEADEVEAAEQEEASMHAEPQDVEMGGASEDEEAGMLSAAAQTSESMLSALEQSPFVTRLHPPVKATPKKSNKKYATAPTNVWLPLVVPKVPKKGEWDVRRLRDSQYFFS